MKQKSQQRGAGRTWGTWVEDVPGLPTLAVESPDRRCRFVAVELSWMPLTADVTGSYQDCLSKRVCLGEREDESARGRVP